MVVLAKKPTRTRGRGKGRPASDEQAVGRDAMITAATQLLTRRAPNTITRAELSRVAGIDPALVRYYFGDMSSLLTEGMIHIFNELQTRRAATPPDAPLRDQLRQRIGSLMEVLEAQPHLHQMLMRPVLHLQAGKTEEVETLRRDYTLASLDEVRAILSTARAKGESVDTDLRMLYVVMIGMADFAVKCFQYFEILSIRQGTRAETLSRFADFVADLLVLGLRPRD